MVKLHETIVRKRMKSDVPKATLLGKVSLLSPSDLFLWYDSLRKKNTNCFISEMYLSTLKFMHEIKVYRSLPQLKSCDSSNYEQWIIYFLIFGLSWFYAPSVTSRTGLTLKADFHSVVWMPRFITKLPNGLTSICNRNTGKIIPSTAAMTIAQ